MSPDSRLHSGAHIVCADRDRKLLDMIVRTLREDNHCVFQAYDGLAALELCVSLRRIDLLITNTSMPGLNGPQLIRQVREELPMLAILYVRNLDSPDEVRIACRPTCPPCQSRLHPTNCGRRCGPCWSGIERNEGWQTSLLTAQPFSW
jgi:CheY-like chemotaxis protein